MTENRIPNPRELSLEVIRFYCGHRDTRPCTIEEFKQLFKENEDIFNSFPGWKMLLAKKERNQHLTADLLVKAIFNSEGAKKRRDDIIVIIYRRFCKYYKKKWCKDIDDYLQRRPPKKKPVNGETSTNGKSNAAPQPQIMKAVPKENLLDFESKPEKMNNELAFEFDGIVNNQAEDTRANNSNLYPQGMLLEEEPKQKIPENLKTRKDPKIRVANEVLVTLNQTAEVKNELQNTKTVDALIEMMEEELPTSISVNFEDYLIEADPQFAEKRKKKMEARTKRLEQMVTKKDGVEQKAEPKPKIPNRKTDIIPMMETFYGQILKVVNKLDQYPGKDADVAAYKSILEHLKTKRSSAMQSTASVSHEDEKADPEQVDDGMSMTNEVGDFEGSRYNEEESTDVGSNEKVSSSD